MMKQALISTLLAASLATSALAETPEAIPGGITPERYYTGGGASSEAAEKLLEKFDALDFEIFFQSGVGSGP